ncbi:hypothetical protein NECAME_04787 [Necator americanus]|uniref:Uncharacterized protein n=1 Tax=Necator americanus TaxID=51031 RepID=W2SPY9_NECAM|nr:hypothetical protein NECAME_04787 [Necator americanus]ETN70936.1 hypothetical protein NECAME_04787 [Necator americanus]
MERESRHSKEEEEELDRKIAQIREKNLKIEERKKEIDADRANYTDEPPRKPSKPSPPRTGNSKTAKGEWDREWDHGKTPAETWRENVPSIDILRKPSGRGGHQRSANRGQRGGQKSRGATRADGAQNPQVNKGSRLEGRVSVQQHESTNFRGRGRGRGGARHQDRNATHTDGELKNNGKNLDTNKNESAPSKQHPRNMRRNAKTSMSSKEDSAAKNPVVRKPTKRRYTEKYEIKKLLRRIVNKVEKNERKEKQAKIRAEREAHSDESKGEMGKEVKEVKETTPTTKTPGKSPITSETSTVEPALKSTVEPSLKAAVAVEEAPKPATNNVVVEVPEPTESKAANNVNDKEYLTPT